MLPTDKDLLIYARQSTKEQVINNPESAEQQTTDLLKRGLEYGWKTERMILYIENQREDGIIRNASGRLRIDQRPRLSAVTELIKKGAGAVMVWDVSRLFRDEDMTQLPIFAKLCKEHHVIVLTYDDIFDFNNPRCDDRKRFLDEAQAAADYLTKHLKKMHLANERQALRGEYDGRGVPVGFMLDSERKYYIRSPHAKPLRTKLFKRFRQLGGNYAQLRREVVGKPIFPELPEGMEIDKIRLAKVPGGYTVKGHTALKSILTNVAYIGWWVHKGHIVSKNNHPAIADDPDFEADFWFAFDRLSDTTVDGEPIQRPKSTVRYQQKSSTPREALLQGARPNGEAVIQSRNKPVYVFQNATKSEVASYVIKNHHKMSVSGIFEASIHVTDLGAIFTERLLHRLHMFKTLHEQADNAEFMIEQPNLMEKAKSVSDTLARRVIAS